MEGVLEYSTALAAAEANEFLNLFTFRARSRRTLNVNLGKGRSTGAWLPPIMNGDLIRTGDKLCRSSW